MEIKLNEQVPQTECVLYDDATGLFYKTTLEKIDLAQKRMNDELFEKGHISYEDMMDILTEDWTPEQKLQHLADRTHGWCEIEVPKDYELQKCWERTKDGQFIIHFNWQPKEETPE